MKDDTHFEPKRSDGTDFAVLAAQQVEFEDADEPDAEQGRQPVIGWINPTDDLDDILDGFVEVPVYSPSVPGDKMRF